MKQSEPSTRPPRIAAAQIQLLERLTNASGVSGNEAAVRAIVVEQVRPYADELKIDHLGNVLATRHARLTSPEPPLRVMVAAHMDEIGFMVIYEDDKEEGLFRFDPVGGVNVSYLVGKAVRVGTQGVPGVIGAKPIHLVSPEERKQPLSVESLRIDVGPGNNGKVKVGDWAVFATPFAKLGQTLRAKALDDRIGVATLIELLRHAPPAIDLQAAFTVQEEIGMRGASVAAFSLDPQLAFALDCTPANDLPDWQGQENTRYNSRLGAGPVIYVGDGGTLADPRLVRHLIETAEERHIPYQIRQPGTGGTDASAIHKRRAGIPSVSLSVPGRYLHTPASLVRLADWKNTLALIHASLERLSPALLSVDR